MFYILSDLYQDVNGKYVSPGEYELSHAKTYTTLTLARKTALNSPTFSRYRQYIYEGDRKSAKIVGCVYGELKGKDIYHYSTAKVWKDLKGKMWYLNKDGTLGRRYYKRG